MNNLNGFHKRQIVELVSTSINQTMINVIQECLVKYKLHQNNQENRTFWKRDDPKWLHNHREVIRKEQKIKSIGQGLVMFGAIYLQNIDNSCECFEGEMTCLKHLMRRPLKAQLCS